LLNNNLQKYGGDLATSSMGVINSVSMMILMPIFGINQGSQPIMGFNYGSGKYDRVKQTLKYAVLGSTVITTAGFILTQVFPVQIIQLFISNEADLAEILGYAIPGLKTYLFMLPIVSFQIVSTAYFQAIGMPKHSMLLSLSRQVLILIPALIILPQILGLQGVWLSGPIADLTASIITAFFVIRSFKELDGTRFLIKVRPDKINEK